MPTVLALVGPDSQLGWVVLIVYAYLPVIALLAVVTVVVIVAARAAWRRWAPPAPPAPPAVPSSDPEATAAYLADHARTRRDRPDAT